MGGHNSKCCLHQQKNETLSHGSSHITPQNPRRNKNYVDTSSPLAVLNSTGRSRTVQNTPTSESTKQEPEGIEFDANDTRENEEVEIPQTVTEFVARKNARKNVMSKFEIIQTLGDGMSSCVYEVNYLLTGQRCALKRLRRSQKHADLLFASEFKLLNRLQCEGVIRSIEAFVDEDYFYVLNELGVTDLFKKIKKHERISEKVAKEIVRHLLKTLKELHHNNVVHRDIKPENVVFVDKDSNFPKLIDFGDALVVQDNHLYVEFVGTQCYLAPERWRQHRGWELKAADIWAIGVLTFEMVTGKRCFYASCDEELKVKIERGLYRYPKQLKPSSLCCHFIQSLLTINSNHRPTAEFALQHPWLFDRPDHPMVGSLIQQWNANATKIPNWAVYKPIASQKYL